MTTNPLRANLILSYNNQAEQRARSEIEDWKAVERAVFLELLKSEHKQSLLEIGAGHGRDSKFFQENSLQVSCIDLSPEMVKLCQQKGLHARLMDMIDLDFGDESFDAVYSLNSLLNLPKTELPLVLREIRRVLKADGLFFLGVYGGFDFEGIWEKDFISPNDSFLSIPMKDSQRAVTADFELLSFKPISSGDGDLHFQSLILRKPIS